MKKNIQIRQRNKGYLSAKTETSSQRQQQQRAKLAKRKKNNNNNKFYNLSPHMGYLSKLKFLSKQQFYRLTVPRDQNCCCGCWLSAHISGSKGQNTSEKEIKHHINHWIPQTQYNIPKILSGE